MSLMTNEALKEIYEKADIADSMVIMYNQTESISLDDDCKSDDEETEETEETHQKVNFTLSRANSIINESVVNRNYFSKKPLRSSNKCGKVAKHELLVLKPDYRGGTGRSIHTSEFDYYRDNLLFDEIQVDAAWSGIIVWKRIGLNYEDPNFEESLKDLFFIPYLTEIKMYNDEEIDAIIDTLEREGFAEIDTQYLREDIKLKDIIAKLPDECENKIKSHYLSIERITDLEQEVNFGLTEYLRVYSTTYPVYKDLQTVPMYRRVK